MSDNVNKLASYCQETLDLAKAVTPDDYGYNNLILCIIDAIFSMGVRYSSTRKTVQRFIDYFDIQKDLSIGDFIGLYQKHSLEFMAQTVYQNRQRTSPKSGILKAEAVLEIAKVLQKHDVEHLSDINKVINNPDFEAAYKAVRGQNSGISLRYFYMLTGDETQIKPDRMIMHYIHSALNHTVTIDEAHTLLAETCELLKVDFPHLTPRSLDSAIWNYQRSRK